MVIEIESVESRPLEEIVVELTGMICRNNGEGSEAADVVRELCVRELLIEFAEEIKRSCIEP